MTIHNIRQHIPAYPITPRVSPIIIIFPHMHLLPTTTFLHHRPPRVVRVRSATLGPERGQAPVPRRRGSCCLRLPPSTAIIADGVVGMGVLEGKTGPQDRVRLNDRWRARTLKLKEEELPSADVPERDNLFSICTCFDGEAIADQDVAALDHLPTSSSGTTSHRVVSAIRCECGWTVSRKGCQGTPSTQAMQSAMEPRNLGAEARQIPSSSSNGCSRGWTVASCTARAPPRMPLQSVCGISTMYSARVQAEVESRSNPTRMVGVRDLTCGALDPASPQIPAEQQPKADEIRETRADIERCDCDRNEAGHEPILDAISGTGPDVWTLRGDAQAVSSDVHPAPVIPVAMRAGAVSSAVLRDKINLRLRTSSLLEMQLSDSRALTADGRTTILTVVARRSQPCGRIGEH